MTKERTRDGIGIDKVSLRDGQDWVDGIKLDTAIPARKTRSSVRKALNRVMPPFLKGPISLRWLAAAGRLPGRALHVAIVLHYQAGLSRKKTVIAPTRVLEDFGVNRSAYSRGVKHLEKAGLILIGRKPGQKHRVTIIDEPPSPVDIDDEQPDPPDHPVKVPGSPPRNS